MARWHHQLNRHEFEQTLGDSEGQGSLVCRSQWGHKELDTTEQPNNTKTIQHHGYISNETGCCYRVRWRRLKAGGRLFHLGDLLADTGGAGGTSAVTICLQRVQQRETVGKGPAQGKASKVGTRTGPMFLSPVLRHWASPIVSSHRSVACYPNKAEIPGHSCTHCYLKWKTNNDLLYGTWNPAECHVAAWMAGGLGGADPCTRTAESLVVHLRLSQRCLLTGYERVCELSRVQLFSTPWTVAHQALMAMEFSSQQY